MIRTALITGICGFSGAHLAAHLLTRNIAVRGIDLRGASAVPESLRPFVKVSRADLLDMKEARKAIRSARPDCIFHLAAATQGKDIEDMMRINVMGTRNVLEAALGVGAKVLVTGSSAEYGAVKKKHGRIDEDTPARPVTIYGLSKLAQTSLALLYSATTDLRVYVTRTFNLVGPGQPPAFICGALANQVRGIRRGTARPPIRVGNVSPRRDFVDVRDAVRAYLLVVEKGKPGELYNVCSGRAHSVKEVLDILTRLGGIGGVAVRSVTGRAKAVDIPSQVGSCRKIRTETGWTPEFPLEQSLKDMLE